MDTIRRNKHQLCTILCALVLAGAPQIALAQTASFSYQGKLSDGGTLANGNYDLQFKLYDALTAGTQIGVRTRTDVAVAGGVFAVELDFAVGAFSGPDRFLEIGVRPAGSQNPFTTLSPRQPITSSPYSFHSLSADAAGVATTATNANQLGGVSASQYVTTNDSRLTDARTPAAGSSSYIQNTTSLQTGTNFNISGNGTLGTLSATGGINTATQYNIGGNRVLSVAGTSNTFAGVGSGNANTTGRFNSFFGTNTGLSNTAGESNSFFGTASGPFNSTGNNNSFFGYLSGNQNSAGSGNSFFGESAGFRNTTGEDNTFIGSGAGLNNLTASGNTFVGSHAGEANTTGFANSFFGLATGRTNTTGGANSFFGYHVGEGTTTGTNNSFFGSLAGEANTTGGDNSFFGERAGTSNTTGLFNSFFGDLAGANNSEGIGNSFFGQDAGLLSTTGGGNTFAGSNAGDTNTTGAGNTIIGADADVGANNLNFATAIGAGAVVSSSNTIVLGRADGSDFVRIPGFLTIPNLAAAGMTQLCRNAFDRVGDCSSSLRYKTNLAAYHNGLDVIIRLRPVTFTWKENGLRDLGFGAEDVEKIDPLLVTYNKQGQVEGVKYDHLNVVLVNAIKEQQQQINAQARQIQDLQLELKGSQQLSEQIKQQQVQIDNLKKLVCAANPSTELCKN